MGNGWGTSVPAEVIDSNLPDAPMAGASTVPSTQTAGFDNTQIEVSGDKFGQMLAAQATATVQARYVMAMRNPRDMQVFRSSLLKECSRTGFAQSAWYRKPVGAGVEGFSIRFAEAVMRHMRNVLVESSTVHESAELRITRSRS